MLRLLMTSVLCMLLAACGGQPDATVMRGDIERVLATSFGEDAFRVVEFARRGSAVDSTAAAGEERRVAYYDIELELVRDLTLGDWEEPGAASLVTLLGAGPRSIRGVKAGGNVAGDRIVAHATAIYRNDGDTWTFIMPAGFHDAGKPRTEMGAPQRPAQEALDKLAEITRTIEAGGSRVAQSVLDLELQRSLARISGRLSRIEQGYPLAAGLDRGEYAAFAGALAAIAKDQQVRILPLITGGSEENIELLRSGSVVVGLAQADTVHAAYTGTGVFAGRGGFTALRALGSLYPEYVHIVVRGDAGLQTAADLKGARIAMGPQGSAVRGTLMRVLAAHGLQAGRDYEPVAARLGEALPALRSGQIDAAAHVIGLPATPLRDALGGGETGLHLLPLAGQAIEQLAGAGDGTIAVSIAAGIYPSQLESVPTVAVPALLVATEELGNEEVERLVRLVYESGSDLLAQGSAQGSQVSVRTARRGLTIPLHGGAEQTLTKLEAQAQPSR